MGTFFIIDRDIVKHWIFKDAEKFKAWIDLIGLAQWKDNRFIHRGEVLEITRGSFVTSKTYLASRWCWDIKTVRRFISVLESEQMVDCKEDNRRTIITILNYNKYQDKESNEGIAERITEGTTQGMTGGTTEGTHTNKVKQNINNGEQVRARDPQTLQVSKEDTPQPPDDLPPELKQLWTLSRTSLQDITPDAPFLTSPAFITAGRRPLKKYPSVWISPPELFDTLKLYASKGLKSDEWTRCFQLVESKVKSKVISGMQADRINSHPWLIGFALEEALQLQIKSKIISKIEGPKKTYPYK